MGVEHLSWLIFVGIAGLSVVMGIVVVIRLWGMRAPEEGLAHKREALRGRYLTTAAVGVECCELALQLWAPDKVRMGWLMGVPIINIVDLTGFWTAVVLLLLALFILRRDRSELGFDVKISAWMLVGISALGGILFLLADVG